VQERPERDHPRDLREVPEHGRRVRQEEPAVRIEHAERPRRQDEQARHWKEDAYEGDGRLVPGLVEARGEQERQPGREQCPERRRRHDDRRQ
jgi:hypothetical protein